MPPKSPPPSKAEAARQLVGRILDAVGASPPRAIWSAARGIDQIVVVERKGRPSAAGTPRDLWKDAKSFLAALAARGEAIQRLALPLLVALDVEAATRLFEEYLRTDWTGLDPSTPEGQLLVAMHPCWAQLAPRLPAGTMVALWRAGRVRLGGLTEAQLAAIPIDELVAHLRDHDFTGGLDEEVARIFAAVAARAPAAVRDLWLAGRAPFATVTDAELARVPLDALVRAIRDDSIGYLHVDDARRVCAAIPELRTLPASLALLEQVGDSTTHAGLAFTHHLVAVLAGHGHAAAIPLLRRLRAQDRRDVQVFTDALFALGDRETIAAVAATLEPTVRRSSLKWDPHHTAPELRDPIRATFALHRERSTEAFAPFFREPALRSDKGAKVALDILLLGRGVVVDHAGTRLTTPDASWLDLDPRWADVVAKLASHPRLGKHVRAASRPRTPRTSRSR